MLNAVTRDFSLKLPRSTMTGGGAPRWKRAAFAVGALAICATLAAVARVTDNSQVTHVKPQRAVKAAIASGGWEPVDTPARDMTLDLERQVGIRNCFLAPARLRDLEQLGWEVVRCDESYLTAAAEDRIGVAGDQRVDRQAALVSIFKRDGVPELVERMQHRAQPGITGPISTVIRRRFNVSPDRETVFLTGFVDASATVHGSVSVALDSSNVCDFRFPDMPLPQTECYWVMGDFIMKLRTNSIDYEAVQRTIRSIAQLNWSR